MSDPLSELNRYLKQNVPTYEDIKKKQIESDILSFLAFARSLIYRDIIKPEMTIKEIFELFKST